jgi:tetratricopeptide (TPR) repeat protein
MRTGALSLDPAGPIFLIGSAAGGRILILRVNLLEPVLTVRLPLTRHFRVHYRPPMRSSRRPTMKPLKVVLRVGMVAAIVAAFGLALGSAAAQRQNAEQAEWQPPLTVDNPFATPLRPADPDDTLPVAGDPSDTELPPMYRLPPVGRVELQPESTSSGSILDGAPREEPVAPPADTWELPPLDIAADGEDTDAAVAPRIDETLLFTPDSRELTQQLLPAIRRAHDLAQRGALYAAQTEFIQVVRRISQVKDAESGTEQHSRALADGLRALDEAGDFIPDGAALEGELDVRIVASAHRTAVVRDWPTVVAPHAAIALYHQFANERLAFAVGGEQAGSVALYGLGKMHARLAELNDHDLRSTRNAMTMYRAALAVCPSNHLAANELGVLACRQGDPAEAVRLFEQAIDGAPTATAYHNLAIAQQKLGLYGPAGANQQEAERLAAWDRAHSALSRRLGIQWVSPHQLAQVASPPGIVTGVGGPSMPESLPTGQNAPMPQPIVSRPDAPKSPWQKVAAFTKSLPVPGNESQSTAPPPVPHNAAPSTFRPRHPRWQ